LVYINDLPNCLNNGLSSMCADDTNISFQSYNLSDLEEIMNTELSSLIKHLAQCEQIKLKYY
jgi:hypothetical protein